MRLLVELPPPEAQLRESLPAVGHRRRLERTFAAEEVVTAADKPAGRRSEKWV